MRKNEAVWQEKYHRWRILVQRNGIRKAFYSSTPKGKGKAEAERKADLWLYEGDPLKEMIFDDLAASYIEHIRTGNGTAHKTREQATIDLYLPWSGRKVSTLTNLDDQTALAKCVEGRKY